MRKAKLALIGKNISHSNSPVIYENLLGGLVTYELLDIDHEKNLMSPDDLMKRFDGVSVTSPYKEHYFNKVKTKKKLKEIGAVNCLYTQEEKIYGENTDQLALEELLKSFLVKINPSQIVLLGNGPMARITKNIFTNTSVKFEQKSRTLGDQMDRLVISKKKSGKNLIINACSREYLFKGTLQEGDVFWDYNYKQPEMKEAVTSRGGEYFDGEELLLTQAKFALSMWGLKEQ